MPIEVDRRYYEKAMNRLKLYHFDNLKKYLPQLPSRADFLEEKWLNLYNRTIYAVTPMSMIQADLTPVEKLKIIEDAIYWK